MSNIARNIAGNIASNIARCGFLYFPQFPNMLLETCSVWMVLLAILLDVDVP